MRSITAGLEQKRKDLQEVEALRHQNARLLVSVTDTTVNGHPQGRLFTYKYQLAGGRTELTAEDDATSRSAQEQQKFEQQLEEARLHGRKEVIKVMDTELDGQVNRLLFCRYTLADGARSHSGCVRHRRPLAGKVPHDGPVARVAVIRVGEAGH